MQKLKCSFPDASLSHVKFQGVSEYSEDLMSRIDAPLLDCLCLVFFDQPIIDTPELLQFMHRSKIFKPPSKVEVTFRSHVLRILLPSDSGYFYMGFQCIGLYRQLSLLNHIFTQPECLPLLSHVYQLDLSNFQFDDDSQLDQQDPMPRLEFLRSFNTVQILNVDGTSMQSEYFLVVHIARVLGGLTSERAAEVLPMMHTLLLKGFDRVGHLVTPLLKPFIDERQLSGQPVVVRWTG
jgi:hypothetical protein